MHPFHRAAIIQNLKAEGKLISLEFGPILK